MEKMRRPDYMRIYSPVYIVIMAFLSAFIVYLLHYVFSGRGRLLSVFFPSSHSLYRKDEFGVRYFTEHVKTQGNLFAVGGIVLCLLLLFYLRNKQSAFKSVFGLPKLKGLQVSWQPFALLVVAAVFWYMGQVRLGPSGDEIFSAVYCAAGSPHTAWAYYMLPNNHVFFNLLNSIFCKLFFFCDGVYTGRGISFVAYLGMLCCAYTFICRLVGNRLIAVLSCLPLAVQSSTYMFALQARGYELQLLFAWVSMVSLFSYLLHSDRSGLRWFVVASVLGFACVPTYLYFFAGQLLLCASVQVYERRVDRVMLGYFVLIAVGVYLFYLPALCFSGVDALIHNEFVQPASGNYADFVQGFYLSVKIYVNVIFSFLIAPDHIINLILYLLPLLLLFARQRKSRLVGVFYVFLWLCLGILCFKMQKLPFIRNLIPDYSVSLLFVVYTLYLLMLKAFGWYKNIKIRQLAAGVCWAIPVVCFVCYQYNWVGRQENYAEEQGINRNIESELIRLGNYSSIAVSPRGFCYYYFARKHYAVAHINATGREDIYINCDNEPLPEMIKSNYTLLEKAPDGYEVWKRK